MSDDPDLLRTTSEACTPPSTASRPGADWLVVALPTEIDVANTVEVLADLLAAIDCGRPVVVADMSATAFCDCAGVNALLAARSHALQADVQMRVVAQAGPVLRTFGLTGLDGALPVYPTNSAALDEAGRATTREEPKATVTELSSRRRTDPVESGQQPDRRRCP